MVGRTASSNAVNLPSLQVARGYRRPHPVYWGPGVRELVSACMAHEAQDRPSAAEVLAPLPPPFHGLVSVAMHSISGPKAPATESTSVTRR